MLSITRITRRDKLHACITREALTSARNVRQLASRVTFSRVTFSHMTRHEDRFIVRSRVTRELPGKICERLQRHTRASVKFKLSGAVVVKMPYKLLYVIQVKGFIKCSTSWPYSISEVLVAYNHCGF